MAKQNFIDYLLVLPSISLYFIITEKFLNCNKSEGLSMVLKVNLDSFDLRLKHFIN